MTTPGQRGRVRLAAASRPAFLKPGDKITVVAHPSRDGSRSLLLFYVIQENGKTLYRATNRYPSESQ